MVIHIKLIILKGHYENKFLFILRRLNWKCNSDFNFSMKKTIEWYLKKISK